LEAGGKDDETLREIQKILYSTEVGLFLLFSLHLKLIRVFVQEGFEVPEGGAVPPPDEEETF
jgi:RP/EB family microtubule-associated protein